MRKIHNKQECEDIVIQQDQRTPKRRPLQSPTEQQRKKKKEESQEIDNADASPLEEFVNVGAHCIKILS